jgi:hypothetical protein
MTMHHNTKAPSWAAKTLATLVAGFVLAFSLPTLALAQAASAPEAAAAAAPKAACPCGGSGRARHHRRSRRQPLRSEGVVDTG